MRRSPAAGSIPATASIGRSKLTTVGSRLRRCWATWDVGWFQDAKDWPGFAVLHRMRGVSPRGDGRYTTCERRYYISSHDPASPPRMPGSWPGRRGHWGIENRLHWCLTCAFKKTAAEFASSHTPRSEFSRVRRLCLNLLRAAPAPGAKPHKKVSLKTKRFLCGCMRDYLIRVISPLIQGVTAA